MDLDFCKELISVKSKMLPYIPEISASKVAGLIGLHAYQPPHEVMYDLLCKHLPVKYLIADLEAREGVGHAQRHLRRRRDAGREAVGVGGPVN